MCGETGFNVEPLKGQHGAAAERAAKRQEILCNCSENYYSPAKRNLPSPPSSSFASNFSRDSVSPS